MFLNKYDKVLKIGAKVKINNDVEELGSAYLKYNTVYTISNIIGTFRSYKEYCNEGYEWDVELQVEGQPVLETWYHASYFELVDEE